MIMQILTRPCLRYLHFSFWFQIRCSLRLTRFLHIHLPNLNWNGTRMFKVQTFEDPNWATIIYNDIFPHPLSMLKPFHPFASRNLISLKVIVKWVPTMNYEKNIRWRPYFFWIWLTTVMLGTHNFHAKKVYLIVIQRSSHLFGSWVFILEGLCGEHQLTHSRLEAKLLKARLGNFLRPPRASTSPDHNTCPIKKAGWIWILIALLRTRFGT